MRLNRASLRRKPETAACYSFHHPKISSDSSVHCLAQIFRKSSRAGVSGNCESGATDDQKADGKFDPPIERSCLTKNFCSTRTSEPTGSGTFLSFDAIFQPKRKISEGDFSWVEPLKPTIWNLFDIWPQKQGQTCQFRTFLQVTDPSFDTFLRLPFPTLRRETKRCNQIKNRTGC